jgi:hypothetical protein
MRPPLHFGSPLYQTTLSLRGCKGPLGRLRSRRPGSRTIAPSAITHGRLDTVFSR